LNDRRLNRALLARQGLLERMQPPLVEAVEAIGAIQAQFRPAIAVALWSRLAGFDRGALIEAFERRELVVGQLLRGTIHAVSAREHALYAAVVEVSGAGDWRRTKSAPNAAVEELRRELQRLAATPKSSEELVAVIEAWASRNPVMDRAELEAQRERGWRALLRSSIFVRVATDGGWISARPIEAYGAPPPAPRPSRDAALEFAVRAHLRAFGPSSAADVAGWTGLRATDVRPVLERLETELERFTDEAGRTLYDLSGAPRPDAEVSAPVRLLPWFDSVLLAYEPARRQRILPAAYKDRVYMAKNLQWLPTFLVDGFVAGTWSLKTGRGAALTLTPFVRLQSATRKDLEAEAEKMLRSLYPEARAHTVRFEG
jgi:hypothetical protein